VTLTENRPTGTIAAALLISAALFFFGTGLHPVWWCMWLAPIPVLLIAPGVGRLGAFTLAAAACFAGSLNMVRYLWNVLGPPGNAGVFASAARLGSMLLLLGIPACVFGAAILIFRAFERRGAYVLAVLTLPSVWVAYEYLEQVASPHSTFGSLAYTQTDFLTLVQVASVTGVSGVIFLPLAGASALAVIVNRARAGMPVARLAAGALLAVGFVVGLGAWRLYSDMEGVNVTVGLAASDLADNVLPEDPERNGRLLGEYAAQARALAARGAKVIVFPEKLSVVLPPQTADIDALFQAAAEDGGAEIVVGVIRRTPESDGSARLNEARWYAPAKPVATYEKHHMLPAFESKFRVGTALTHASRPSGIWGLAICKDMDFPSLARQNAAGDVALLLVPAWDFTDDGWLHDRMAVMRGVESGFSIARADKQGLLTISDDRGRVLAEVPTSAAPFASLVATVPVAHDATLYARFGDWFAWLNIGLLAFLVARSLLGAARAEPRSS